MVNVTVLGDVGAVDDSGDDVGLGGPVQRRLLAVLVAAGDRGLSTGSIVEHLWDDHDLPADPNRSVRTYVTRLRNSLGDSSVATLPGAYAIGDVEVDSARFEDLVLRARRAGDSPTALGLWSEAVGLWRGPAFDGFEDLPVVEPVARRLEELKVEATEAWIEARLLSGEGRELVADVEKAVAEHPLREGFRAQQMTVLARAGRQPDALRAFQEFRVDLTEIGLEPSEDLARLDGDIVAGRPVGPDATRTLRGYELSDRLGEGAFSVVFKASQSSVGREVAIKQIRSELANRPEFIRQFEAEAHLVGQLEHPHIVPLYDYWREPGSAYLVMRYMRGGSLAGSILEGPLDLGGTVEIANQVADALGEAHRHGVVHRDVKPANILLDDEGRAYLSDFGIAVEEAEDANPEAWLSNGSPAYASPEQLRREAVGPESDVHGLGIAVFEALTGRVPFPEETTMAGLLERSLNDPIPLVRTIRPEIPGAVDAVLQKATAKERAERYGSANEFARSLAAASGLDLPVPEVEVEDRNPYKGLRAFDETDASDFAGRERLTDQLLSAVGGHRLTAVVGPSGSGKSSVVRAGLLPAVRQGRLPGSGRWYATSMIPGTDPFADLEAALLRVAVDPPADLGGELRSESRGLARMIRRLIPRDRELLVVVDQFEELFTLAPDADRRRFLDCLVEAAVDEGSQLRVVFTIRADFFDHPLRHPAFAKLIEASAVMVHPLAADELERAITEPARTVGATFEPGLLAEITADVADQPGALPLLQYALTELFEQRRDHTLTMSAYRELGGVSGALARRAEELFQVSDSGEQKAVRRLFGRLVNLGEGSEDTRRRVLRVELSSDEPTRTVLDRFGDARLLSFDRDPISREPTVEVAHEALIREWPRLRHWLDDDRDGLRILRQINAGAAAWQVSDHDESELFRGGRLQAAEEWAETHAGDLNEQEARFLEQSKAARAADVAAERRRLRRLRGLLAATAIVAAVALIAGAVAFQQRGRANDKADLAQAQTQIAEAATAVAAEREEEALDAQAETADALVVAETERARAEQTAFDAETGRLQSEAARLAPTDRRSALLLAAESYRREPSAASLSALQRVLTDVGGLLATYGGGMPYTNAQYLGGDRIAASTLDAVHLFDVESGALLQEWSVPGLTSSRRGVDQGGDSADIGVFAVSADGLIAAASQTGDVGSQTGAVTVLEPGTDEPVAILEHPAPVTALAFGPAGKLATGDSAGTVRIWTVETAEIEREIAAYPATLGGYPFPEGISQLSEFDAGSLPNFVIGLMFDDSGQTLVSHDSYAVSVWDVATGDERHRHFRSAPWGGVPTGVIALPAKALLGVDGPVVWVMGRSTVTAYDMETGETTSDIPLAVATFAGLETGSLLSSDRAAVLAVGSVRLIDLAAGEWAEVVDVQAKTVNGFAPSPDGATMLVATDDGVVRWSLDGSSPMRRAVPRAPTHATASASVGGTHVMLHAGLSLSGARPALWDITGPMAAERELPPNQAGQLDTTLPMIRTFNDRVFEFFDLETFEPLGPPIVTTGMWTAAVAPDRVTFAYSASVLGTILIHDIASGRLIAEFDDLVDPDQPANHVFSFSYNADGSRLIGVKGNGRTLIWDVESTEPLVEVEIADATIWNATYSPWGGLLVLTTADGRMHFRAPDTLEELRTPIGLGIAPSQGFRSTRIAFSPDNRFIVSITDGQVRLFDVGSGEQIGDPFPHAGGIVPGAFSDNVLRIVTADETHAFAWHVEPDTWPVLACKAAGRSMTRGEWEILGPRDSDYVETCAEYLD